MIDTTILLSFLCPLLFMSIHCGRRRLSTIPPTHHPPLCQPEHDKPFEASGLAAFGLAAFGLVASGSACSGLVGFQYGYANWWFTVWWWLATRFGTAGCVASGFSVVGLVAAGFEELGLLALSLVVVRFKQHQVKGTNAAETTSVTKTPEHNASKSYVEKAMGLSMPFLVDGTLYQF